METRREFETEFQMIEMFESISKNLRDFVENLKNGNGVGDSVGSYRIREIYRQCESLNEDISSFNECVKKDDMTLTDEENKKKIQSAVMLYYMSSFTGT